MPSEKKQINKTAKTVDNAPVVNGTGLDMSEQPSNNGHKGEPLFNTAGIADEMQMQMDKQGAILAEEFWRRPEELLDLYLRARLPQEVLDAHFHAISDYQEMEQGYTDIELLAEIQAAQSIGRDGMSRAELERILTHQQEIPQQGGFLGNLFNKLSPGRKATAQ